MRCTIRTGVITFDFYPLIGGIGRHTYLMYTGLKELDLLFFSPSTVDLPRHVPIGFLPVRLLKQAGVSLWLHFNAPKIIAEHRLDRLNIHTGPGGVLCIRKLPVPVVVTCHHTYRQQCSFLPSQFWKRIFIPFEARTYRLADRLVAVSEATSQALVESYGIPQEKITVIRNAVDPERLQPAAMEKKPSSLLYLGRLDRRKGIDFLIRSMPLVREQYPGVRLQVAGTGSYREKMVRLVNRLGLERNVEFLGFVPDGQLNALLGEAACVVVPSVFEGFGITVIEALAAGTRVVGTDTDGIREILRNPGYGRLVPYGDTRALADAIVAELRAPRPADPLGPEFQVGQFLQGYREVLAG